MTQSMIGYVVGLVALIAIAVMVVQRYRRDHPAQEMMQGMNQWLDAHHMSWMHHKH